MDFQLSDDQRAIAEMAGSLFGDLCSDDRLRAFTASGDSWMADLWAKCVETGLHALAIPEAAGGSGLGMTDLSAPAPGARPGSPCPLFARRRRQPRPPPRRLTVPTLAISKAIFKKQRN